MTCIFKATNLAKLDILDYDKITDIKITGGNKITKYHFKYISKLINVKTIHIYNTCVEDIEENINFMSSLTKLVNLELCGTKLLILPENIDSLKLISLNIHNNNISILPSALYNMKTLKYLTISTNPIQNISDNIENLISLLHFRLEETLVKVLPQSFACLINLERIYLKNHHAFYIKNDNMIIFSVKCKIPPHIKHLTIEDTKYVDFDSDIPNCLESLNLHMYRNNQMKKLPKTLKCLKINGVLQSTLPKDKIILPNEQCELYVNGHIYTKTI